MGTGLGGIKFGEGWERALGSTIGMGGYLGSRTPGEHRLKNLLNMVHLGSQRKKKLMGSLHGSSQSPLQMLILLALCFGSGGVSLTLLLAFGTLSLLLDCLAQF